MLIWWLECNAVLMMRCANLSGLVRKMFGFGEIGSNGIKDLVFVCCGVMVGSWKLVIWSICRCVQLSKYGPWNKVMETLNHEWPPGGPNLGSACRKPLAPDRWIGPSYRDINQKLIFPGATITTSSIKKRKVDKKRKSQVVRFNH
jgi:hypothetical protein